MVYTVFGRTGVKVSRIGFGGAPAGLRNYVHSYNPREQQDREGVFRAVCRAIELGINYFDTAPGYGNGESENLFGEAFSACHKEVFVATKVTPEENEIRKSLESSLKRLRRERIDLLQIHGLSYTDLQTERILSGNGLLEQIERLRDEKIVRFIGFTSEDNNDALYKCIKSGRFDSVQMCYNFIFQHPYEPSRPFGSLFESEKAGLGIASMRAPTSGTFQKWIRMVNPANTFNYTPALLQFVLSNPLIDVALIGMRSVERVEQNVAICNDLSGRINLDELHNRYS